MHTRIRLTTFLAVFALLVASCGGSGSSVTASGESGAQSEGDAASEDRESFEDLDFSSPIADFLGQDFDAFEFDEAAMIEQQRESELLVAECMRGLGFEYTPPDMSQMMSFGGPMDFEFDPGSREWVEKYGFGISTMRFPQSMVGDLVGMPGEDFMSGPPDDFVDPNQEYVEGLSDGERDAYYEALYGEPPDIGPGGPDEDFVFEPSGCQAEGFMNGPFGSDDNAQQFYQAFDDEMRSLYDRIESDSRIVAFDGEINACVVEASGMTWNGMDDLYNRFGDRLNELQPGMMSMGDPFEEAGLDPENMSEREINDFITEMNRLSPESLGILAEIQAEEIALATAVDDCGGGQIAYQKLFQEVRVEYEQAFLDENADAIAQYAGGE